MMMETCTPENVTPITRMSDTRGYAVPVQQSLSFDRERVRNDLN
jgi:hypothetical protein